MVGEALCPDNCDAYSEVGPAYSHTSRSEMGLVTAAIVGYAQSTMPLDAQAQFEQTVLDLIDHSPVGAVPYTPAYQDALKHLYASHQVYASADHKGGHVTARSLATAPVYHAANLAEVAAGRVAPEALELNAAIFDRYVAALPVARRAAAEGHRLTVAGRVAHHRAKHGVVTAHDPIHTLFLVPGTGPHPGLPGNYLYGSAFQLHATADSAWLVQLHDAEDGAVIADAPTLADALAKVEELLASAPFNMNELSELGFRFT
jgi:hypothetical protein